MTLWLIRGYFAVNMFLYAVIAFRTTLDPDRSAAAAGFQLMSRNGRSEFVTSYAGLMCGLTALFAILAIDNSWHRLGLVIAIMFYLPIVAYRIVPALIAEDRFAIAAGTVGVEALMLGTAVALLILQ